MRYKKKITPWGLFEEAWYVGPKALLPVPPSYGSQCRTQYRIDMRAAVRALWGGAAHDGLQVQTAEAVRQLWEPEGKLIESDKKFL